MQLPISAVKEDSAPSKEHARVFHQLLGAIEAVRLKRQEEYRDQYHPQLKRFTQQELNDEACPAYKNWLIGRSTWRGASTRDRRPADKLQPESVPDVL